MTDAPQPKRPRRQLFQSWPPVPEAYRIKDLIWQDSMTIPSHVHGLLTFGNDASLKIWKHLTDKQKREKRGVIKPPIPGTREMLLVPHAEGIEFKAEVSIVSGNECIKIELSGLWSYNNDGRADWFSGVACMEMHWNAHILGLSLQRCQHFGATMPECIAHFMSFLTGFANSMVKLRAEDFVACGAPVLKYVNSDNVRLFDDDVLASHKSSWYSKSFNKLSVTQLVRDGYITHDDPKILKNVVLPLVIMSQPCNRQLVIVDKMPKGLQNGINTPHIIVRHIDELMDPAIRARLKAPQVSVIVCFSVIYTLQGMCANEKICKRNLNTLSKIAAKYTLKVLRVNTIFTDLAWDRVITHCKRVVTLPGQTDHIGFWWTLCAPTSTILLEEAPPLTQTQAFTSSSIFKETRMLLNRHRMIDLSYFRTQ